MVSYLRFSDCGGCTDKPLYGTQIITDGIARGFLPTKKGWQTHHCVCHPFQSIKKEEKSIPLQGELEGAKPASNEIKRPEKPA